MLYNRLWPLQGFLRLFQPPVCHTKEKMWMQTCLHSSALIHYVQALSFQMESLQQVTKLIQQNDFLTSIHLTDAFLHIAILNKHSRKYLRFHWEGQAFQFRTAPFGLSVVPWLFTRVSQDNSPLGMQQDFRVSAYLDDWIIMAPRQL